MRAAPESSSTIGITRNYSGNRGRRYSSWNAEYTCVPCALRRGKLFGPREAWAGDKDLTSAVFYRASCYCNHGRDKIHRLVQDLTLLEKPPIALSSGRRAPFYAVSDSIRDSWQHRGIERMDSSTSPEGAFHSYFSLRCDI